MRFLRSAVVLAALTAQAAPAVAQIPGPVVFGDQAQRYRDTDSEIHLFFDRDGNLYPPAAMRVPSLQVWTRSGSLRSFFRNDSREWARLAHRTGIQGSFSAEAWSTAQEKLIADAAQWIVRNLDPRNQRARTLVLLIHGFRVPDAENSFRDAERVIRTRHPLLRPLFVHVHWDGHFAPLSMFGLLPATWSQANRNAPLVGLAVRRVVARIPDGVPVRVITHSLGGAVAASAFWNWPAGIRLNSRAQSQQWALQTFPKRYPLPTNPDIRIGMIVPAIPGEVFPSVSRSLRPAGNYPLLVIGQNRQDVVVSKAWIDARLLGSTALAVDPKEFCRHVMAIYRPDNRAAARIVNFDVVGKTDFDHGMPAYFQREPIRDFLSALLAPAGELGDSACT